MDPIRRKILKTGAAATAIAAAPGVLAQQAAQRGAAMSFYEKGPVRIHYEETGSGFPLLLIAGGGLNSTISGLNNPFNAIQEFKGEYRCIAADLRNANTGQSSGPLELDRPWDASCEYAVEKAGSLPCSRSRRPLVHPPAVALQFAHAEDESMAFDLVVNGSVHRVDADPQTPLLWVIRDHVGLTGTKFSCGIGQCGACTLHVDGRAIRSCSVPAATAIGKPVVTIEGLSPDGSHPIQVAWKEFDTPQCGYCQSGMIMSALALLRQRPAPSDADIDAQVTNACRCSTYHRVRQAIHLAANLMKG